MKSWKKESLSEEKVSKVKAKHPRTKTRSLIKPIQVSLLMLPKILSPQTQMIQILKRKKRNGKEEKKIGSIKSIIRGRVKKLMFNKRRLKYKQLNSNLMRMTMIGEVRIKTRSRRKIRKGNLMLKSNSNRMKKKILRKKSNFQRLNRKSLMTQRNQSSNGLLTKLLLIQASSMKSSLPHQPMIGLRL